MKNFILIVEDSKTLALYEKETLEKAGHSILVAYTLDDVKAMVRLHKTAIILAVVDVNLPKEEDQALDYLLKYNIPSIAMTASFRSSLRDKIIHKNIIDYIVLEDDQKLELLQSTIARVLLNHKRRILIVDDSISSRSALKNLLKSQNFTIHEASNGMEALLILKEHADIGIAFVDYEMPGMSGAELTRIIRKSFSRMELSILAISIHTAPIITIEFLKAGANDFITKPYVKEEILARIAVNIDLIDQHHILQNEVAERKEIETALRLSQQKAESANLAKSNFLANMSHEIRTPMNAIIGFVDVLCKGEDSPSKSEKLNIIKSSGISLMAIIDDILDFSKIESGKTTLEKIVFKTREPFMLVTRLFEDKAKEKNISITLHIDENIPEYAHGDITKIKQILSNLLSNALKFSHENSKVKVLMSLSGKSSLLCSVSDQGIGIAPKNIDRIFAVFEQEDTSTTRQFGGSGLGLSISKALAQAMNGDISVESKPNEGSTFLFKAELFKNVDKYLALENKEEIPKEHSSDTFDAKVLLVEDNKSNQLLMKILLERLGLSVDIADDGLKAVEAYTQGQYDIILMDENMPHLNGLEATAKIRQLEEAFARKTLPIIAVTANSLKGDRERFLEAGMDDYLSKPIDVQKLETVLRRFLPTKASS